MDVDQGGFSFDDQLLYHVRRKNSDKAKEILKRLSDPLSKVDSLGNTLLHYVAQCCNDVMMKYLIDSGAKVDVQNNEGQTPLWLAIDSYYNRFDYGECKQNSVLYLLDAKANMHICDKQGRSPLSKALAKDDGTALVWLFKKLNIECLGNVEKIAQKLIEANSSVYAALYFRNIKLTRILLNSGCPVEPPYPITYAETALQASVWRNNLENVRALLDHGADPNAESEVHATPMITYSSFDKHYDNNPDILQLLLDRGANPTKILTRVTDDRLRKKMQMFGVLWSCNRESIRVLLRSNVDLKARDEDGYTALHYVIPNERPNVLDEFEGKNFDANARSNRGSTPLLYAMSFHAAKRNKNLLKFLLRHGADPNAKDHRGMTALMHLCRFNFVELYRSSLEQRVDIEKVKRNVEYLLQNGADPQVVTPNRLTVFNNEEFRSRVYPVESVLAHLAMLEERGTPLKEIICNHIEKNKMYKTTFLKYKKQLQAIKKIKIWKSLTLHEFLFGNEAKIKRYLRSNGFTLKLNRLSNKCTPMSYYCYAMRKRISRILYSIRLKKEAAGIMTKITGIDFEGYPNILDKLYSYLTEKDLLNICRII